MITEKAKGLSPNMSEQAIQDIAVRWYQMDNPDSERGIIVPSDVQHLVDRLRKFDFVLDWAGYVVVKKA